MLFILLVKLFQLWPLDALSGWFLCLFDMLHPFVFWTLPYFLLLHYALGSSCVFPVPDLQSTISLKNAGSFYWRMVFRNQNMDTGCVCYYWNLGLFFSNFWPCHVVCRILVPQPGIEPMPPTVEARSLNHWAAREVPGAFLYCPCLYLTSSLFSLASWSCGI